MNTPTPLDAFGNQGDDGATADIGGLNASATPRSPLDARKTGDTYDADSNTSKTPPHKFGKPKGSIFATPNSRDSHHDGHKDRDAKFHEVADSMKSGLFGGRRKSKAKSSDDSQKQDHVADNIKPSLLKRLSMSFKSEDVDKEDGPHSPNRGLLSHLKKTSKSNETEKDDV